MGIVCYWYWHLILPVPVLEFLQLGSLPVQAQSITRIGIQIWCLYWYWHFCTLVQYQYGHIPLPELGSQHGARTGNGIFALRFSTNRHSPLPVLAFRCACTRIGILALWFNTSMGTYHYLYWCFVWPSSGTGISALLCSTGRGTFHYRYWHSTMVPVLVRAFLHFGSVPVKAQSITGTSIQKWCPYQYCHFCILVQSWYRQSSLPVLAYNYGARTGYWHFGTFIQYQYWHGTLLVLALKNTVPIKGICALWFGTNNNTIIGRLQ
jgi:hypothetical protein